ncbi:MAG: hypothetical protein ACXW27_05365 [Allosphingosinicella sp.]
MHRIWIVTFAGCLVGATAAQSAPRQGVDAPERAAGNPDKIVCKTFTRIGSLADRYRTCKTKAEWERERANHQDLGKSTSCRMIDGYAEPCK